MLAAAATAVFLVLDIRDTTHAGFLWQWWALGVFLCFVAITTWTQSTQQMRIHSLEDERPKPIANLRPDFAELRLEIENQGEAARFSCQVRFLHIDTSVHSGIQPSADEIFWPNWHRSGSTEAVIARGGSDSIQVAVHERSRPYYIGIEFPFTASAGRPAFSVGWIPMTQPPLPHASVELEFTVTSTPSRIGEVLRRTYRIDEGGHVARPPAEQEPALAKRWARRIARKQS